MTDVSFTDTVAPLPDYDVNWEKNTPYVFGDLTLVIEYFSGDERTKVNGQGTHISNIMPSAYGYIVGTTDAHGEEVDMYLASMPDIESDIFVIDQVNPTSSMFDEHKVMLGFGSLEEAIHTYMSVFSDGSGEKRLGSVSTFSKDMFNTWIGTEGAVLLPASRCMIPDVTHQKMAGITSPVKPTQDLPAPRDCGGGVVVDLVDMSRGPKIITKSTGNGYFDYHLYLFSGLGMEIWSNTTDTLCRMLDLATNKDTFHIHIASPGGSVLLMGRIISAINGTRAKVITYAEGCVASAATSIWASGHERHIRPGAYFMQHMSSQLLLGKTTDIAAKSVFSVNYIQDKLQRLVDIGLFTQEEVNDMVEKSADIFISGREAIRRMGLMSTRS